jgi:hypothetical protein
MPVMPDDADGGTTGGEVWSQSVSLAVDEVLAAEPVGVGLVDVASGEIEDTGVDTALRASASPSVPLLDVPLTEAVMEETTDVVLDHADHKGDDMDVSAAAIAVSKDADVVTAVLEVQVVSLPYCRGRRWRCACGRWVACAIMAREANVAVYKGAFSCILKRAAYSGSRLVDPYPLWVLVSSRNSKRRNSFGSNFLLRCDSGIRNQSAEGTNSKRNDWRKEWLSLAQRLNERMKIKRQKLQDSNRSRSER